MNNKIIIDVRLLSKGGLSGIEEYTTNLIDNLLLLSAKEEYLMFYNGFKKVPLPSIWVNNPRINVIDKSYPNKILDMSSRFIGIPNVENFTGKGRLVFSPHFNILKTKLPHIVTFHDLSFLHHPNFFSNKQKVWHWLQGFRNTAKNATHCIAVSEFTKNDLVDLLGIPEEKISVIYSGINSSFRVLKKDSAELLDYKMKNKLTKPFILYLGTLEPRKNIPALIRAFDKLKSDSNFSDFELVLAGKIGWLSKELFREIERTHHASSIRFIGSPTSEDRVFLYNLAEIFAYPSFFEGFGFQPLEAQACGVPVISSNRTSLPEILGDSAKFINPWSVDELCDSMKAILATNSLKKTLIESGIKNSKRFSWSDSAKRTLGLYNKIT